MKELSSIKNNFLFIIILLLLSIKLTSPQIQDNFISSILEEGNHDLLDVTDYHNISLIVSSSKVIYIGIPPIKKTETNANLIKFSSIITINQNYLLVACLQDSFLGKINLSNGAFTSLLSYSDPIESKSLEIPKSICSLSYIENTVYIGYSQIVETSGINRITNFAFRINIKNKESIEEGPLLNNTSGIKYYNISIMDMETPSLRQLSCQPLRILNNYQKGHRLICLYETTYIFSSNSGYKIYAVTIDSSFDKLQNSLIENAIVTGSNHLGFRFYREDDYYARCVSGISLEEVYLDSGLEIKHTLISSFYNLNADLDLISYNNKFIFSAQKIYYMGKKDIYSLQINQKNYKNYYRFIDYKVNNIQKILGYFDENVNKVIFLYQTDNNIKYFIIDNKIDIFALESFTHQINVGSYQQNVKYDLNELITTPNLTNLGFLNVEMIEYKIDDNEYFYEYFGQDFFDNLMSNNILIPKPSINEWKTYNLSFIENIKNEYTRIYHLADLTIKVQTCEEECLSCWSGYDSCTDCSNENGYASVKNKNNECYPTSFLVDGYIFEGGKFLYCFDYCEFCSEASDSITNQKCTSCYGGLLYSYNNPGNCYEFTDLDITEDKEVDSENNIFVKSTCTKYKIAETGECVEECPLTTPYYTYKYNDHLRKYEKIELNPPKYLGNNICYSLCPDNYITDEDNNQCICYNAYYKDNNGFTICLLDQDCISEYPYQNTDTKECFKSLENCDFIFGSTCYNNCPDNKITLSSQSQNVINYIKEKLSLNENLIDKTCICNGTWKIIDTGDEYYQDCLSSCPSGFTTEEISNQCIEIKEPSTIINIISTNLIKEITDKITNVETTNIIKYSSTELVNNKISTEINNNVSTELMNNGISTDINNKLSTELVNNQISTEISIDIDPNPHKDSNCPVKYKNICYPECPLDTCLTQQDPELKTCIKIESTMQVFNEICFDNFNELTNNIKSLSETGEIISTDSGIIIRGYSTNSKNEKTENKNANYSLVYLGDCENKIKSFYNLPNDTELFILGIDSPNKDTTSSINVYNYGVYLENGTLLDHKEACKESKIAISTPIKNPDLIKLDEAVYFSDLGYDIFDENSQFYKDTCSSASIDGNDIVLSDRKKDFYPEGISLCNDSCTYNQIDLDSKRFTCECDLSYNYSEKKTNENNNEEKKDDSSYIDYFLSLINYKIIKCHKLFLDYKSYYYNAGFYIAVGTLVFCEIQIFIFIKCGIRSIDIVIFKSIPNKMKLMEKIKEQNKKNEINNNPPKKSTKTVQIEYKGDLKSIRRKSKLKNKTLTISKKINMPKKLSFQNISNDKLQSPENNNGIISDNSLINKVNALNEKNETLHQNEIKDGKIENRDLNVIPYTQALRDDRRNCFQIFLSVFYHEIKIINIFYYRHPYEHLSIILSEYIFELCLDLTLNSLLYTEDVISEKYNNNGSIRFFTTLSLSFISNIISSIICYFLSKLTEYADFLEFIIRDITDKSKYYLNIIKFKKLLCIKLTGFFLIQNFMNLVMCYYLMIFCTVYHNTQGSIMVNYITGIAESMAISLALTLIISILRAISIKYRFKSIYYTSKYFFEKF